MDTDGIYRFPFDVLDKTPGGSNLGRIEWHVETLHGAKKNGRYHIEKLYVWATQTRDPRYKNKVFEITSCCTECVMGFNLKSSNQTFFLSCVWRMMICEIHKAPVLSAYPEDKHSVLEIGSVWSSIGINIDFK